VNTPPVPPGFSFVLQTNEVLNGSQTLLDLHAGNNITLTDNGLGQVTVAANGASFSTAGQGGFVGAGFPFPSAFYNNTTLTAQALSGSANIITAVQFQLLASYTIRKISLRVGTGVASSSVNIGIYDSSGNRLIDSGAIATTASGTNQSVTLGTPVTLAPGTYYFAQSATGSTNTVLAFGLALNGSANLLNLNSVRVGQAANATSGGVMPATLGTITADSFFGGVAAAFFEV